MDTVTYPDNLVREEIAGHWLETHLDVVDAREVAALFNVVVIPTAVVAAADGTILGRVQGFIAPTELRAELAAFRAKR